MIEINNLSKSYGSSFKLEISTLSLKRGEVIGLIGNNGMGKTTFLYLLTDMIKRDAGRISIDGTDVAESYASWKEKAGFYFNESFLIDFLTAEEYFSIIAEFHKITLNDLNLRLSNYKSFFYNEILDKKKYIQNFSSGNKQKIGIASALIHFPELILFDEPIANLDPTARKEFSNLIRLHHNENTLIILSSHDLHLVEDLCTRIIILDNGTIKNDIIERNNFSKILNGAF